MFVLHLTVIEVKRRMGSSQQFAWQEDAQSLDLSQAKLQEDIWLSSPAKVSLTVRHIGDRLQFDGQVSAVLTMVCGRCLNEFSQEITYPLAEQILFARPVGQARGARGADVGASGEAAEDDEDIELAVLEGDTVDATSMVRDTLLTYVPMKPLCHEDCRGLCPSCGLDLNTGSCACAEQGLDPRLAALAQWLDKK